MAWLNDLLTGAAAAVGTAIGGPAAGAAAAAGVQAATSGAASGGRWSHLKIPPHVAERVLASLTSAEYAELERRYRKANRDRRIPADMVEFLARIYDHTGNTQGQRDLFAYWDGLVRRYGGAEASPGLSWSAATSLPTGTIVQEPAAAPPAAVTVVPAAAGGPGSASGVPAWLWLVAGAAVLWAMFGRARG